MQSYKVQIMKNMLSIACILICLLASGSVKTEAKTMHFNTYHIMTNPIVGTSAPDFTGTDQHGKSISLSDFLGKTVVLYFYPKDDTPGCTAQACNFRDNYEDLTAKDLVIIGVSTDSEKSHKKFAEKYKLPFSLIADIDQKIVTAYGVWQEKSFMGNKYMGVQRSTFIINEKGILKHIIEKSKTKSAVEQVLKWLDLPEPEKK